MAGMEKSELNAHKVIFVLAAVGLALGLVSAFLFSQQPKAQPPVFTPAANPYANGIYSDGMIESDQAKVKTSTFIRRCRAPSRGFL